VDLEGEEEESPGAAGQGVEEEPFGWVGHRNEHGWKDSGNRGKEGKSRKWDQGGDVVKFVEGVKEAPEIGHFVFEKATSEREYTVD